MYFCLLLKTKDMKKFFTLMVATLAAASFTAFAQNNNEV